MPVPSPLPCPECAALVWDALPHLEQHCAWHYPDREDDQARGQLMRAFVDARRADDDAGPPTAKLPPVGNTIRRRPPVPGSEIADQAARLRTVAEDLERLAAGAAAVDAPLQAEPWACALHPGQLWFTEDEWRGHVLHEHPWSES